MSINLRDVGSGYKRTSINANFTDIETEINNNLLSKNGGVGLEADLDANSQKVINLADGILGSDAVNLRQLNGAINAAGSGLIASQAEVQLGSEAVANVFTLSSITYTVGGNNLYVFRNGQKLGKGEDYTETSTSSITLTFTPNANDRFEFITNISTTNSITDTAAITHTEDSTNYNLATYLQNRHIVNVLDYLVGGSDIAPAMVLALADLPTSGGEIFVPDGMYTCSAVTEINKTAFPSGRVKISLSTGAVINIDAGSEGFVKFVGTEATPFPKAYVEGGQINGTTDGASYGVLFQNTAIYSCTNVNFFGFKSTSRASLNAGMKVRYGIYGEANLCNMSQCDIGIDAAGNALNTYRSTTFAVNGGSYKTCYRGAVFDDLFSVTVTGGASFENSNRGILFDATRTTGLNSCSCNVLGAYFERNGAHVEINSYSGAVRSRGFVFEGNVLENVATTYLDSTPFETVGAGDNKLIIGADDVKIGLNFWSSSSASDEIRIKGGSSDVQIEKQSGTAITVDNSGDNYLDRNIETPSTIADGDTTPSLNGNFTFHTANTGATTITNFDDMVYGEEYLIVFKDANTTIDFSGTNLKGNNNVDYIGTLNEALKVTFDGTNKYCTIVS